MEVIKSVKEMQRYAMDIKKAGKSIGFVPTMGFLHKGHQRLIQQAREQNEIVIVSIFVNPLQFGPSEDFDRYPRDETRDRQVCETNHVDVLFLPDVEGMYPTEQAITHQVTKRTNVLCGRSREGHFEGVVTVLAKLFNITLPERVYFGLKDAQQVAVVDSLVNDLNYPLEIIPVPTVREEDGLAKSSRNVYLTEQERREAPYIYRALQQARQLVVDGEKNPATIVREVKNFIEHHTNGRLDYVEVLSYPELEPTKSIDKQMILATAVHFTQARLIDNIVFNENGGIIERLK